MQEEKAVELLKISIPGKTIIPLLRARSYVDIAQRIWNADKIRIDFSESRIALFTDDFLIDFSMKYFTNSIINVSYVELTLLSSLKDDLQALFVGNEEEFSFGNFNIHIYLVKSGHHSQFWVTFQLRMIVYEIDILQYSFQEKGVKIPTDVFADALGRKIESPRTKLIPIDISTPAKVEPKIVLPKVENDTTTKENDEDLCKICMLNDLCTINLPCGHMQFCIKCAHDWKQNTCPSCRRELTEIKKVFK